MKRFCCDGRCYQGRQCPAFAPGVIDGPYFKRNRFWRALLRWIFGPDP